MPLSRLAHAASDGTELFAVVSLGSVRSLNASKIEALSRLGIDTVADLLHFDPIHHARLLLLAAQGGLGHDLARDAILRAGVRGLAARDLVDRPAGEVLAGIGDDDQHLLTQAFGVRTVADLAAFEPFLEAQRFLRPSNEQFQEPASAPDELVPRALGSTRTSVGFSTFVKERTLRLEALQLGYDEGREHFVESALTGLFAVTRDTAFRLVAPVPVFHLAHVARLRQVWTNEGTHLGEVIHSLALAPGESRNIAVLDWKRRQATRRGEETRAEERLSNELFHTRALDEVTRSTANEHQFGGTKIEAATVATSLAATAGVAAAGAVAGSTTGAAIGALLGLPAGPVGAGPGALAGLVIGGTIGAAVAVGASGVLTAAGQSGTLESDSSGDREIVARVAQDITETTIQKASSVRSLWSTVIVTDEQNEQETLSTRNVTNYNHSHTLNLEYYEILQRYRTEIGLAAADPLLLLPFRPLEFDIDFIAHNWDRLRVGVTDPVLRERFDAALRIIGPPEDAAAGSRIQRVRVFLHLPPGALSAPGMVNSLEPSTPPFPTEVRLLGLDRSRAFLGTTTTVEFDDLVEATRLTGISLENPLLPGLETSVEVTARLIAPDGAPLSVDRLGAVTFDDDGVATFTFDVVNDPEPSPATVREIERYLNDRRYAFTRLLLITMEREQLVDLVEALLLTIRPHGRRGAGGPFVPLRREVAEIAARELGKHPVEGLSGEEVADILRSSLQGREIRQLADVDPAVDAVVSALRAALDRAGGHLSTARAPLALLANRLRSLLRSFAGDDAEPLDGVHLTEFVEPGPIAITDNALVLRMRTVSDAEVLDRPIVLRHLQAMVEHPAQIAAFVTAGQAAPRRTTDVFLPTSGVFAEGILGRANSSEKVDPTRYTHWEESPIPHQAPLIAALVAGQQGGPPLETTPIVPGNVLNIVNPSPFPDATGLTGVLAAIQNGNMFRDQSGQAQLVSTLGSLAQVASAAAQQSSTLAGSAREQALQSATGLATKVADLVAAAAATPAPPRTNTGIAGALNLIEQAPNPDPLGLDPGAPEAVPSRKQEKKERVLGVGQPAPTGREVSFTVRFVDLDGAPLLGAAGISLQMDFGPKIELSDVSTTDVPPNGVHQDVVLVDARDRGGEASIVLHVPAADGSVVFEHRGTTRFAIPPGNVVALVVSPAFEQFDVTETEGKSHREKKIKEDQVALNLAGEVLPNFAGEAGANGIFDAADLVKIGANIGIKIALALKGSVAYSRAESTGEEREDEASGTTVTVATVKRALPLALEVRPLPT